MKKDLKELIQIAIENKKNSYSPYSKFRVSSVVLTKKGNIYKVTMFSIKSIASYLIVSWPKLIPGHGRQSRIIVGPQENPHPGWLPAED